MTRLAHVSDLHLLESDHAARTGSARIRLRFLTFARHTSAAQRRRRAITVLACARHAGADHVVITGDLTEDGVMAQFEILAEVLSESGWLPGQVTLVPGNHDAYARRDAWPLALAGPLRAYAATSAQGAVTHLQGASVIALSTVRAQHFARAGGAFEAGSIEALEVAAAQARREGRALVVAQHHPPVSPRVPLLEWVDGLEGRHELIALLERHDHAHVLHGHTHVSVSRPVRAGASMRIHSVESAAYGRTPLRMYGARHGGLWVEPAPIAGFDLAIAPAF